MWLCIVGTSTTQHALPCVIGSGPHFARMAKSDRQRLLREQYFFDCCCPTCLKGCVCIRQVMCTALYSCLVYSAWLSWCSWEQPQYRPSQPVQLDVLLPARRDTPLHCWRCSYSHHSHLCNTWRLCLLCCAMYCTIYFLFHAVQMLRYCDVLSFAHLALDPW